METQNPTEVTDDQIESQITELSTKTGKTDEDSNKLSELKTERQTRYQKRINELTYKTKSSEEKYNELNQKFNDLTQKYENVITEKAPPVNIVEEMVDIGGKKYYTDATLLSMRDDNKISDADAWKYSREREKAEVKQEVLSEMHTKTQAAQEKQAREQDIEKVMKQYPQFSPSHPNHNPEDALYKEASRIFSSGYRHAPNGLSMAITDAKRILGLVDGNIDNSDNFSLHSPTAPKGKNQEKTEELSETEKDTAIRLYRDMENPATKRSYTDKEAIEKATKAKQSRRV